MPHHLHINYHRAHTTQAHTLLNTIMADSQPPAQAPAGESAENLHTDPVTGEKISKTELKRRTKQREKDEKKKEKTAALPVRRREEAEELNPNVRVCTANGAFLPTDRRSNTSRYAPTRFRRSRRPSSPIRTRTSSTSTPSSSTMSATIHACRRASRSPTRRSASVYASSHSGPPRARCTSTCVRRYHGK